MRKDFLVSPYQLLEARVAGAGGVLLIAAMLGDRELREMLRATHQLGLFALVEVFDRPDLDRAVAVIRAAGPAIDDGRCRTLLGVNCRDLRTLQVDFGRFAELAPHLPRGVPTVAESGVESAGPGRAGGGPRLRRGAGRHRADARQRSGPAGRRAAGGGPGLRVRVGRARRP